MEFINCFAEGSDNPSACLDIVAEPANRGTTLTYPYLLLSINNNKFRSGQSSLTLLEESYVVTGFSLAFWPFSPFFETFNERILDLLSNGIIDHWFGEFENAQGFKRKVTVDIGPQVLTMEHLEIGFIFCLVAATFSVIAFMCEHFVAKL